MVTSRPVSGRPSELIELLVVGTLTIDRFPDGSAVAGGSVLHAARAAARARAVVSVVTAAGSEPEAQEGLRELRRLAAVVLEEVPETLVFEHDERDGRRQLSARGNVRLRPDARQLRRLHPRAMLLAPVAGELDAVALRTVGEAVEARIRVAMLQGWLRWRGSDGCVATLPLTDLPGEVLADLRNCDAVVVSHEDLGRNEPEPDAAAALDVRRSLPGPGVLVTWGRDGYVRADSDGHAPTVVRRRHVIEAGSTVGAGDTFAAVIALQLARGASLSVAARSADAAVERFLARQPGAVRRPLPT